MWVGCMELEITLCKTNEIIDVVRADVTGYQDLGNRLLILKMVLEVC